MSRNIGLYLALTLFLSACGGGGDSKPIDAENNNGIETTVPNSVNPAAATQPTRSNALLNFTPTAIRSVQDPGESIRFSVKATPKLEFNDNVYVYIIDRVGVISADVEFGPDPKNSNRYITTVSVNENLTVGEYQGNIEVRVCKDPACNQHYTGSPIGYPYDIKIVSEENLTPISISNQQAAWSTFQGNARHDGYVAITLDADKFNRRWRWQAPQSSTQVRPVVSDDGQVFVVSSGNFAQASSLYALKEQDKSEIWKHDFGNRFRVNDPAVSENRVYVASSGHEDTAMWILQAKTGELVANTPFRSQWESYLAPTIVGQTVYTNGGSYGGLNAFNSVDGSDQFFTPLAQYDYWTPAVDENHVYAMVGGNLSMINPTSGEVTGTIRDPSFEWHGWTMNCSPILGRSNNVISLNQRTRFWENNLVSFNTQALSVNWSTAGTFSTHPAVANGVIFVADQQANALQAFDEVNGTLLWSWSPNDPEETGFDYNIVATDNIVFTSTNKRVHAIDIATQKSLWSYRRPGYLALSNAGILYITTMKGEDSDGALVAINLY